MITKLIQLFLALTLLVAPAFPRLQVNQFAGFSSSEMNSYELFNWYTRVRDNGGTVDNASVQVARSLLANMRPRSYWPKLLYIYPFLGTNLAAARVPLKYQGLGGTAIAANNNFVNGDFTFSTGLQGNGSTKYLAPGFSPGQLGTSGNGGYGWWENNYSAAGSGTEVIGSYSNPNTERYSLDLRAALQIIFWGNPSNNANNVSAAGGNGDFYGQRSGATSREIFKNGTSVGTNTTSDSASGVSDRVVYIFACNATPVTVWAGRCACAYFTDGTLTTQEVADLHNDLQNYLITPTGR